MVTILPKESDWSEAFESIGKGASQGYQNRSDEMALQKAIGGLGDNPTPRQILDAVTNTKTYNPASKQNLFKNYLGAAEFEEVQKKNKDAREIKDAENIRKGIEDKQKKEKETAESMALLDSSELGDEEKTALRDQVEQGKLGYRAVKDLVKPKKADSTSAFEKSLSKEHVKQYVEAEKAIVQSQRNLNDLDRIEELNKQVGPLDAINPFSEEASELEALGFGVIEPIVKIFNPSGPIAQKKLEQLQNRYGIKKLDSAATIRGKSSALRRYANYAKDIAEQRIELFKKYKGNPPLGEIARLDLQGEALSNKMSEEDPSKPAVFYSKANGKPVKAPDLATQEKWFKEGLITDVKP